MRRQFEYVLLERRIEDLEADAKVRAKALRDIETLITSCSAAVAVECVEELLQSLPPWL